MKSRWILILAVLALCANAQPAAAQNFPSKPIRFIVTFPPGGPADLLARSVAPVMGSRLGQPVVVENRAGAGGVLGVNAIAKSAPDGYTIGISGPGALVAAPFMMKDFPYDVMRELQPLTLIARIAGVVVTNPGSGFKTVKELIARAKSNPGKISYASAGAGTLTHLAGELLKIEAGIDLLHVPYKGGAPAAADLVAGRVQLFFPDLPAVLQFIRSGKLIAIAVTTRERAADLADVPTMAESGLPAMISESLYGMLAPAGLPGAVRARLNGSAVAALEEPAVVAQIRKLGATPSPSTPDEYRDLIQSERNKWERVIKVTGTTMQ
jgi:tripartite-type tricarboxylate transporter receptor subunit TctC